MHRFVVLVQCSSCEWWGIHKSNLLTRNGMRIQETSTLLSKETTKMHGEKCDGVHRARNNQIFAQCLETMSLPWSLFPHHYCSRSILGINLNKYKLLKYIVWFRTSVKCQHNQLNGILSCVCGWWNSSKEKCGPLARQQQLLINLGNKRGKKIS